MLTPHLNKFKLDHIGIAVHDLQKGFSFYQALGFLPMSIETVPTEKVKVGLMELANDCRIELLEPTEPDSPIGKFLTKKGPGLHHICLRVDNLHEVLHNLKQAGLRLIHETPVPGAHNCWVAFVHPSSAGGVLVELSQPPNNTNHTDKKIKDPS